MSGGFSAGRDSGAERATGSAQERNGSAQGVHSIIPPGDAANVDCKWMETGPY